MGRKQKSVTCRNCKRVGHLDLHKHLPPKTKPAPKPRPAATNDGETSTSQKSRTKATSLVGLTRQFKELQTRWGSTENELRTRFREVRDREREVAAREKELEEKETKAKMEMEAQQNQLESSKYHLLSLKPLIVKHEQELHALRWNMTEKKKEVDLIEKRSLDFDAKLKLVEERVEEKTRELEKKERELSVISEKIEAKQRSVEEFEKEMEIKRGELVGQIDAKEILVREKRKEYELIENRVVESHRRCYYFERCVEEKRKEFETKEKELEGMIELKRRELDGVLVSIQEQTKECDVKRKQVMALEWSIRKWEKEMELKRAEWSRKVELKEMELEKLFENFELRGKQFEPIVEELGVLDKRVDECLNEGMFKERYLQSREKSIQELKKSLDSVSHELLMKEKHIEEEAKQLELKQVQFNSEVKTQQLEREKNFASLKSSLEQQEHSLDALQKSIGEVKGLSERQPEQQDRVIVLEEKKLDSQLLERKEQLACKKQFDGFQKLVQEQKKHLDSLSHTLYIRERQVEEHGKELDFSIECLELVTDDMIFPQSVCDQPNINDNGRSFVVIPVIIRNLIETKQLIKAVAFICTFKQIEKFPPVPLLKKFVEDGKKSCIEFLSTEISHDVKEKVLDDLIADLRAVIKCIEDHSLEPQYPPIDIMMEIQGLGELRENLEVVLSMPWNVEKQEQRKRKKQSSSIKPTTSHTYQLRKRT